MYMCMCHPEIYPFLFLILIISKNSRFQEVGVFFTKMNQLAVQDQWFMYTKNIQDDHPWSMNDGSSSSSLGENSSSSSSSSTISSLDTTDDASSSLSFDLSSLMCQLPIKRGLSKFYNGKSESFTSLSKMASEQDLAKKETPYKRRRRIKAAAKSSGAGFDAYKSFTSPKPTITKKASTKKISSSSSYSSQSRIERRSFIGSRKRRPPLLPVTENP
ncbi:unnamed protein product [Cuscuta europaea]|uniref:Uncharacterized protein n=1 Tax=Cuscuta europaea TaxID=41803 RepID=A0A9P0Z6D1_CUSEU|nr:unnamed protein product [Cuscuta europaea]